MSEGFAKLFDSILESSVWGEPAPTVKVWITMLLKADKRGHVLSTVPGLVRAAALKRPYVEAALAVLSAPDPDSRTPDNEGRRIEAIDGGWRILNSQKYRERRTDKQVADARRQQEYRDKERTERDGRDMSQVSHGVTDGHAPYADADAEAYGRDTAKDSSPPRDTDYPTAIAKLLGLKARQLVPWHSMLTGMTQGLGSPGMKAVPWSVLHEAAVELSTQEGEFTAHRFKRFVDKVLERATPPRRNPPSNSKPPKDKASRSVDALNEWLSTKEAEPVDAEVVTDGE